MSVKIVLQILVSLEVFENMSVLLLLHFAIVKITIFTLRLDPQVVLFFLNHIKHYANNR